MAVPSQELTVPCRISIRSAISALFPIHSSRLRERWAKSSGWGSKAITFLARRNRHAGHVTQVRSDIEESVCGVEQAEYGFDYEEIE